MRGTITQRRKADRKDPKTGKYHHTWLLRVERDMVPDAKKPGALKRRWHVETFRGTRDEAEAKLSELLSKHSKGQLVTRNTETLATYLPAWLEIARAQLRPSTYVRYRGIIAEQISKAPIAEIALQKLRPSHVEAYYASHVKTFSASTLTLHHAILHRALRAAVRDGLLFANPSVELDGKPRRSRDKSEEAQRHCWSATEARRFLDTARAAGPQPAAFYALALDTGARKGELAGLRWANVDLDAGRIRIVEQLLSPTVREDGSLDVGPTKTGRPRTVTLGRETVELLRAHRKAQRELQMANRTTYHDHGLVFSKGSGELRRRGDVLGHPLQTNNIGEREFATLTKAAGVKRIKFHGLRHTCATLLLQAGQPVHVVSERLGHAKVSMTLEVYAHVLPDMQQSAADALSSILHG